MKYQPCGKRSQGRLLKRILDCQWDQNRSRDLKPCKLYNDDISFTHLQLLNSFLPCKLKVTGRACKGIQAKAIFVRAYYRPKVFQEFEAARFGDNRHMNVVPLDGLRTGRLYPQGKFLICISVEV